MTSRILKATLPAGAVDLMQRLDDQVAFPGYAGDIASVTDVGEGLQQWELTFRNKSARWVQRTWRSGDPQQPNRIEFEQVTGDFQHLRGSWTTRDVPEGCEFTFEVNYATSVPHLAGAIDSAVGRVLVRSAYQVLRAVGGPAHVTAGGHYLWDLPVKLAPAATTALTPAPRPAPVGVRPAHTPEAAARAGLTAGLVSGLSGRRAQTFLRSVAVMNQRGRVVVGQLRVAAVNNRLAPKRTQAPQGPSTTRRAA